jgi:putative membrane protein
LSLLGYANPWRFQADPEVYLLVAFLVGAYVYMVRAIGPAAVKPGEPVVTRRQLSCFVAAVVLLFVASTWPVHQIGEEYLYSMHMVQHMILSYFMPPLVLLAMPQWLLRTLIGTGRAYRVLQIATKPLVAGLVFNAVIIVTHIPTIVDHSVQSAPAHYSLHFVLVMASLLMWMPVVGPFPELQIGPVGKMIYLFAQSVVPVIPAAWLTFADGVVYNVYDQPVRVWNLTVTDDQQLAGAIMKIGGSLYLWGIVVFLWARRFGTNWKEEATYRRTGAVSNGIATAFPATSASPPPSVPDWVPRDRVPVTRESAPISSR